MTSSADEEMRQNRSDELERARASDVSFAGQRLVVTLTDGRELSVPLEWFPRLSHASAAERDRWELMDDGEALHWEELDEDLAVRHLLLGRPSYESDRSFQRWLSQRQEAKAGHR